MDIDLRLGMQVVTSDGERLGKVDRLVVEPDTQELLEIIVHKGFLFSEDRIVDIDLIERVDDEDGTVVLSCDRAAAEMLPHFNDRQYQIALGNESASFPVSFGLGTSAEAAILWREREGSHAQYSEHTQSSSGFNEFEYSPGQTGSVEVHANLPRASVTLNSGTDVIDIEHHKLGTIDEIQYDERGQISSFIMRSGFFHHSDIEVPIALVAGITHDYVRLNVKGEALKGG